MPLNDALGYAGGGLYMLNQIQRMGTNIARGVRTFRRIGEVTSYLPGWSGGGLNPVTGPDNSRAVVPYVPGLSRSEAQALRSVGHVCIWPSSPIWSSSVGLSW